MKRPIICAYYFPNWHVDPRNEKLHGRNWTEWQVVRCATPRFEGHLQPNTPLWGYEDEADPAVMERKIEAAAAHGIDAFVFDYYYFADGPYRERCLLEGFLPASNCGDLRFALMWANHDPIYAHPGSYLKPAEVLWSGDVSPETFLRCTDHVIDTYFRQPNYLRVDGKLYFSFFRPAALIRGLGGIRMTRILFDDFRRRTAEAGLGELNLDAVFYSFDPQMNRADLNREIRDAGFDSCSNYSNLRGKGFPSFEYDVMTDLNDAEMRRITRLLDVPYHPVITTGFDNSPRTVQSDMYENIGYPFTSVAVNNTPEAWERCLRLARSFTQSEEFSGQLLHLSCWNEWTEGAYLEPDTRYGTGKLDAVLRVFGRGNETTGTKEHS